VNLIPVQICKISSNDTVPLIYLPKEVQEILGLRKGTKILLYVDEERKRLVIEKLPAIVEEAASSG
jgi:bifunctional DNA-binding transcriptional regulator/antitoxin component of YhaV-PrlF toxin-antitoxin module